jgi:hypothetical protein
LATGLIADSGKGTVTGMLTGAGLAGYRPAPRRTIPCTPRRLLRCEGVQVIEVNSPTGPADANMERLAWSTPTSQPARSCQDGPRPRRRPAIHPDRPSWLNLVERWFTELTKGTPQGPPLHPGS